MSLLKSYSFGSFLGEDEIPEKVLNLFQESVKEGKKISYASEIVYAGLSGNIELDKPFYLDGYERAIVTNERLTKSKRKKKELFLDTSASDDYDEITRNGGIHEDRICLDDVEDIYESVLDSEELKYAVSQIKSMNSELIVVDGVNLIEAMKLALNGFPKALAEVKRICEFYPKISECVKTVLSCGESLDKVFA